MTGMVKGGREAMSIEIRSLQRQMGVLAQSNDILRQENTILKAELTRRDLDARVMMDLLYQFRARLRAVEEELYRVTHPFQDATNRARHELENIEPRPLRRLGDQIIPAEALRLEELATVYRCSRCKETLYSSKDEQIADWPIHQEFCVEKPPQQQ